MTEEQLELTEDDTNVKIEEDNSCFAILTLVPPELGESMARTREVPTIALFAPEEERERLLARISKHGLLYLVDCDFPDTTLQRVFRHRPFARIVLDYYECSNADGFTILRAAGIVRLQLCLSLFCNILTLGRSHSILFAGSDLATNPLCFDEYCALLNMCSFFWPHNIPTSIRKTGVPSWQVAHVAHLAQVMKRLSDLGAFVLDEKDGKDDSDSKADTKETDLKEGDLLVLRRTARPVPVAQLPDELAPRRPSRPLGGTSSVTVSTSASASSSPVGSPHHPTAERPRGLIRTLSPLPSRPATSLSSSVHGLPRRHHPSPPTPSSPVGSPRLGSAARPLSLNPSSLSSAESKSSPKSKLPVLPFSVQIISKPASGETLTTQEAVVVHSTPEDRKDEQDHGQEDGKDAKTTNSRSPFLGQSLKLDAAPMSCAHCRESVTSDRHRLLGCERRSWSPIPQDEDGKVETDADLAKRVQAASQESLDYELAKQLDREMNRQPLQSHQQQQRPSKPLSASMPPPHYYDPEEDWPA